MDRRTMLQLGAACGAGLLLGPVCGTSAAPGGNRGARLGIAFDSFTIRLHQKQPGREGQLSDPLAYLDYCHKLGAGGIQMPLGTRDAAYCAALARQAAEYGMFVVGSVALPRDQADIERFTAEVESAKRMKAKSLRTVCIPGRRYEQFRTYDEFHQAARGAEAAMRLAEPVVRRHQMPLAVENHKDWRTEGLLDVLKRIGSEWLGVCLDTGNNIALLEDPLETADACAPWTFCVHLKDMAVRPSDDGFLLAEVPLGQGFLDLPAIIRQVRQAKPDAVFALEMMTRDPLRIPCRSERYRATFGGDPAAIEAGLDKILRNAGTDPLRSVSQLPVEEQLVREEENIRTSLRFAHEKLGL